MKITQLAAKPQLIKLTLDDSATLKEFGDAIEFWTWDRQPMDVFMKMAKANQKDVGEMIGIVKDLILDENGVAVISDNNMLPSSLLIKIIGKIVETLGK